MSVKKNIATLLLLGTSSLAFVGCSSFFPDNRRLTSLYIQQHRSKIEKYEKEIEAIKRRLLTSDELDLPRTDAEYLYVPSSILRSLEKREKELKKY